MWVKLAIKLFLREFRRGELTVIFAAIALAVLTVFSLSSVTERISKNITNKSNDFIAADRRIASNHALDDSLIVQAKAQGLTTARMMYFDSMLFANDSFVLASIKAASSGYPLRGNIIIKDGLISASYEVSQGPRKGSVWLTESLFYALDINVGEKVELGAGMFTVEKILVKEPDSPFFSLSGDKKVLLNYDDIETTKAVQPGSRVFHRILLAGAEQDLLSFYDWLKPQLKSNQRWEGVKDRQSPLGKNLQRAESFLLLAGLFGIMLAAVAMAVSAKRYCERQYDPVAMMKTLGGSREVIRKIFLLHLALVTTFSVVVGLIIGFYLQSLASNYLAQFMGTSLPESGLRPILLALSLGIVCAFMFSLKPLLDLFDIPPLRVLRRSLGDKIAISRMHITLCAITIFILMWVFSRSLTTTLILFVSVILLITVLFGVARLFFGAGRRLGLRPGSSWSLAIATLQKRANANAVQLISFALAIKLMLFLLVLKNDIISDWQTQIPADAPNSFIINIAEQDVEPIKEFFTQNSIFHEAFYPVFKGRIDAVNGEDYARRISKQENEEKDEDARRGVSREPNLTWLDKLPESNEIVEGQWFSESGSDEIEVSVFEGWKDKLEVELGDELTILINEQRIKAKITSFREVDWGSLKPNFVMILSPNMAGKVPVTYFTAAQFKAEHVKGVTQLLRRYPTVSMLDIKTQIEELQIIITQVSLAISFVLAIVLISGSLVLISQVQASLAERMQEVTILRVLGASGRLIKLATLYEFLLLGALAGLVAAIVCDIALFVMQNNLFDLPGRFHPYIWLVGPISGALFVSVFGYFLVASALKQSPQKLLRKLS